MLRFGIHRNHEIQNCQRNEEAVRMPLSRSQGARFLAWARGLPIRGDSAFAAFTLSSNSPFGTFGSFFTPDLIRRKLWRVGEVSNVDRRGMRFPRPCLFRAHYPPVSHGKCPPAFQSTPYTSSGAQWYDAFQTRSAPRRSCADYCRGKLAHHHGGVPWAGPRVGRPQLPHLDSHVTPAVSPLRIRIRPPEFTQAYVLYCQYR